MTLKTCTCGKVQTTKNAKFVARCDGLGTDTLYFNCLSCDSTFCVVSKVDRTLMLIHNIVKKSNDWTKAIASVAVVLLLTACGAGGGAGADVQQSVVGGPSASFNKTGSYTRDIASGIFGPCPNCMRTCGQNMAGSWTCSYTNYLPPAACTMEMIGAFDLNSGGADSITYEMILPGGVGAIHGTPYIDWQANPSEPISFSGDDVTFTNHGFTIQVIDYDASHSVIAYAPGCALLYTRF